MASHEGKEVILHYSQNPTCLMSSLDHMDKRFGVYEDGVAWPSAGYSNRKLKTIVGTEECQSSYIYFRSRSLKEFHLVAP